MTPSELKAKVEANGSYYFYGSCMKHFGDTMENYGVRSEYIDREINDVGLVPIDVWEL